jgi:hypothetical protein
MAEYSPAKNPQVITPEVLQTFNGMRGNRYEVLTTFNADGDNLSNQFANEVVDIDCDIAGEMHVRPGCVKVGDGLDSSITSIFQVSLGGITQYALFYGDSLDLIDIPDEEFPEPLYEDPDTEEARKQTMPDDWPTGWPTPNDVTNDVPAEDSTCSDSHTHAMAPATLSFSMDYQGTAPAAQYVYDRLMGWWQANHVGVYSTESYNPSTSVGWLTSVLDAQYAWDQAECTVVDITRFRLSVNGKDSNGDWLAPGTYNSVFQVDFGDGTLNQCGVTLTISRFELELTYTVTDWQYTPPTPPPDPSPGFYAAQFTLQIHNTSASANAYTVTTYAGTEGYYLARSGGSPEAGDLAPDETITIEYTSFGSSVSTSAYLLVNDYFGSQNTMLSEILPP